MRGAGEGGNLLKKELSRNVFKQILSPQSISSMEINESLIHSLPSKSTQSSTSGYISMNVS